MSKMQISDIDFFNPVRILSGEGCFKNFTGIKSFGRRAYIVCGKQSARLSGALDDALRLLSASNIDYRIFDRVEPNPLVSTCYAAGADARDFKAEFIIGIGGGSPLDAAKAVAAYAENPHLKPGEIFDGKLTQAPLPILAVNLTAGTGSEVTPYSILSDPESGTKRTFKSECIFPRIAFLDPSYTASLPREQTAATAVDALSHAVESYFGLKSNNLSQAIVERAVPMLSHGIHELSAESEISKTLRTELLYASTLAGLAIARTGTGFVHAMGYPLTFHNNIPHGVANAYFLADFVEFMAGEAPQLAKKLYELCGIRDAYGLHKMISSVIRLNFTVDDETLRRYTGISIRAQNVKNSVRTIDKNTMYMLYKKRLGC